ncbi:MAG: hypothetical protein ACI9TY_001063 [Alphaproteobacteria bacterium]|jgi:hypothetical protein
MEQHYWWIFALAQPIGFAGVSLISQHYKQPGTSMAMMRASFVVLCLLPFMPFIELPTASEFFYATAVAATLAFVADSLMMNSFAKFGAGATSRLLPISPLVAFVIWAVMNPEIFTQMSNNPLIASGLVASLVACAAAIGMLSKCDVSKSAFIYLLPVIAIYGVLDVANKMAQDNSGFWSGIVWYTFILASGSVILGVSLNLKNKTFKATVTNKIMLKAGFLLSLCYLFAMIGRNISMVYTPNPAYTSIIAGATPLLIVVYHKIFKIEDKANVKAGLLFAMSILLMIYLATLLG